MTDGISVSGADDFYRLSKALKNAGKVELRKQLNKQLREAAKPLVQDARDAARRELPQKGGLAAQVAKSPIRVQVRTGARTAGVRITGRGQGLRGADRGRLRHPVFGNRDRWVTQDVKPGWFTGTMEREAPKVKPAIDQAIQDVADVIVREAKHG